MTMFPPLEGLITREDIAEVAESEGLDFADEDCTSILEAMRSIDVQACPGSGKTTLIAAKLILLAKKWPYKEKGICVLSHTNVAKNEIIERIVASGHQKAKSLLSYPHFIGTIQEFVGKYVAFPYIRSQNIEIQLVDTELCVHLMESQLSYKTRNYISRRSPNNNPLLDFALRIDDGKLQISVPLFPNGSSSDSFNDLWQRKFDLIEQGFFFFHDVYVFAELALLESTASLSALQSRFPCVFLDEMQDTRRFQDDLLNKIFPGDDLKIIVQRFGDPDQAIFQGSKDEEPNESFNKKAAGDMDFVLNRSHRFDGSIAERAKKFSLNEVPLQTAQSEEKAKQLLADASKEGGFQHTLLIYDDDSCDGVIRCFAELVSRQFSDEKKKSARFCVKAVGAVGNTIDETKDQLKIGHYWPSYDKDSSKGSFRPTTLHEAVKYCRSSSATYWSDDYKMIMDCFIRLLRLAALKAADGQYHTMRTLQAYLRSKGQWTRFRKTIFLMLRNAEPIEAGFWSGICREIKDIFEFEALPQQAVEFMAFSADRERLKGSTDTEELGSATVIQPTGNSFHHSDGFMIEHSTIHGVKGETHDATLVLETKNHCYDIEVMLPFLTGCLPSTLNPNLTMPERPHASRSFKPNKMFLRQLYVAMSRPRHLLCLAVHLNRITAEQEAALQGLGWNVLRVSPSHQRGLT